jgi:hypothetical protein
VDLPVGFAEFVGFSVHSGDGFLFGHASELVADVLGEPHGAELGSALGAKVRGRGRFGGQRLVVERFGCFRVHEVMAQHGVFLVPTLITCDAMFRRGTEIVLTDVGAAKNWEVLKAGKDAVEMARTAGVRIGFGSDLMGELEDEQLAGLRLQCEVLGVYAALRSATSTNAALLRA